MKPNKDSLVLYKQSPALVRSSGEKIEIVLPGGKSRSVREKDLFPLHPGPVAGFPDLESGAPEGAPEEAWELLQGESPSLSDLAELVYGEFTPSTAWMAFKLLNRTPWFRGLPDAIEVADADGVAEKIRVEREKAESEARWKDFIGRFESRQIDREGDESFLRDLEMFALGRSKGSRILKSLGKAQSPENAHRIMLTHGVKDQQWNPHPLRLEIPLDTPDYSLGPLPPVPRQDLTGMEAFAIDDEDNTDPDDALCWDGRTLWVHVADAAALVPADSPADLEARERAGSLYLPEKTVPMLPPEAAARLGLGMEAASPAMSYAFTLDPDLRVTDFSIHLTTVRVTRLSYAEVEDRIAEEPFATLLRIADAASARREDAGAVSIRMPEVKVHADSRGEVAITPLPELRSRRIVSEAMVLAGSHAAAYCLERGIPIPFAVQDCDAEPGDTPEGPVDYAAEFKRRRGMKRSRITLECARHAGLGLEAYTRVTSPLRRYPDLLASRQIRHHILGEDPQDADAVLAGLAAFESRNGSLVQAERRSCLFWKLQWLSRRPGWTAEAHLVDRRERQGFFLIPEIALETRAALKNDLPIGSRVILALKEVDIPESSVLFVLREVLE